MIRQPRTFQNAMAPHPKPRGSGGDREGPAGIPSLTDITVFVQVRPTEDGDRIASALAEVFPDMDLRTVEGGLIGRGTDPNGFREGIRRSAIADTVVAHLIGKGGPAGRPADLHWLERARDVFPWSGDGDGWSLIFHLNKQAAMAGRLHLGDGTPALGDVEVRLELLDEPTRESLLQWIMQG
jgi:predicted RNA binding protein with dsRBD fold (UPF0201 family)